MALSCASRFAVLKLDDDDATITKKKLATKNKKTVKPKENDKVTNKIKTKKPKISNDIAELHSIVFGTSIKKSKKKSGSGGSQPSKKQWEEWQKKDSEFVSDAYEQDLQEALLLSKIDYEENKKIYKASEKEAEQNKQAKKKKKSNQKKEKGVMSLNEFQNSGSGVKKNEELDDSEPSKPISLDESNFFDKIEEESGKIIYREQRRDIIKAAKPLESARALQFQEELRKKDVEIKELNESLSKLKEEVKNVKTRNKKLYNILESGEMREKAEILVQIEDLLSVKDELTEQLKEYHIALEQERSKVHSLQTELKKYQNIKKNRTESK